MQTGLQTTTRSRRTDELFERATQETDDARRQELLNDVVVVNMPVARSIAWTFRHRGLVLEDLEQCAHLALVRAVQKFEADRGHDFLSYAVPCIKGALKRHFRDTGWTVRPPRAVQELQPRIQAAERAIDPNTGRRPSVEQIAAALDVEPAAIKEAVRAQGCFTPTSLDLLCGEDDATSIGDCLVALDDEAVSAVEARAVLRPVLARLSAEHRELLEMRFVQEQTQQQIAEVVGISQPGVSRLLNEILAHLRALLTESELSAGSAA
jgi:RNA polymerase sigma-B factor